MLQDPCKYSHVGMPHCKCKAPPFSTLFLTSYKLEQGVDHVRVCMYICVCVWNFQVRNYLWTFARIRRFYTYVKGHPGALEFIFK